MRCAIMQPTYLPWMGYFALVDAVDVFVLLDNVQFVRRSWQARNRMKLTSGSEIILSVPVKKTEHRDKLKICNAIIDDTVYWRKKHLNTFYLNYAKASFISSIFSLYKENLMDISAINIAQLNVRLITKIADFLGIESRIVLASSLETSCSDRVLRLVNICKEMGATTYVSAAGSAEYLHQGNAIEVFAQYGMDITIQNYQHPVYPQINGSFLSHMCILDLIANTGPEEALGWIRRGHQEISAGDFFAMQSREKDAK